MKYGKNLWHYTQSVSWFRMRMEFFFSIIISLKDMHNVKKKLSCRLLIPVLSFIVLFVVLLYSVWIITKVQFPIRPNTPTMNHGNSKTRGWQASTYYVMKYLEIFHGKSMIKMFKWYLRVPRKVPPIITGSILGITLAVKRDEWEVITCWVKYYIGIILERNMVKYVKNPLYHKWTDRVYHDLYTV